MPRITVRAGLCGVGAALLLAGCGAGEPAPLKAAAPLAPADLCSLVPASARAGLVASSTVDESGDPTAACSLRSPEGVPEAVRAVITWVQPNDDLAADNVYASQCRAVDTTELRTQSGFRAQGADQACAATGTPGGEGSTTMSAVAGREVVTVRLTSGKASATAVTERARQMLESVVRGLSSGS